MTPVLLLLFIAVESNAAEKARMATGRHSLTATFDDEYSAWNFFHDVDVRCKTTRVTLVVLDDLGRRDNQADLNRPKGGLGDPLDDGSVKWPVRPEGQEPWLPTKRKVHGSVNADGSVRFGFTTIRDGKLVSLHFVGRSSFKGASGKVSLFCAKDPVVEGTWKLHDPFAAGKLIQGFNGTNPIGR